MKSSVLDRTGLFFIASFTCSQGKCYLISGALG